MSALAYTDQFTIESYLEGEHITYLVTTKDGIPQMIHLGTRETTEPNGLKLSLSVKPNDTDKFLSRAKTLYKYFDVKPNFNIPIELSTDITVDVSDTWFVDSTLNYGENYVLMSNILYKIPNQYEIKNQGFDRLVMKLPTGSVSINPGREALSLDENTVKTINDKFLEISKEYVNYAVTAIMKEPTPKAQLLALHTFTSVVPYTLDNSITTQIAPTLGGYYNSRRGSLLLSSSYINFKEKLSYRKTLREIDNLGLSCLKNTTFLVIDQKTNWKHIVDQLPSNTVALTRPKGVDFEVFLQEATNWLNNFGQADYLKASEFEQPEKTSSSVMREGIYVSPIYNGLVSTSQKAKEDIQYIYLKSSNTTLDDDVDAHTLGILVSIYNRDNKENQINLVAVPKKYQKLVKDSSNFTPALPFIQEAFSGKTFKMHTYNYNEHAYHLKQEGNYLYTKEQVPADIKKYYTEFIEYTDEFTKETETYTTEMLSKIKDIVDIKIEEYSYTVSLEDLMNAHPLLEFILDSYRPEKSIVKEYLELAYYKEQQGD